MNISKRKICFIITSKIHYARSKFLLIELKNDPRVELQIVVGASAILPVYGDVLPVLAKDGFEHNAKITMTLEGGTPVAMAKTAGIGITELATAFENLQPDIVVVRADRYEVLSATIAAAYLNIPVAHIEGGDVSGSIDESVRHAITKLAHIHFPTNNISKQRIVKMGEREDCIFDFGACELEFVARNNYQVSNEFINSLGVGDIVNINKDYLMVMQHPVTSEIDSNRQNIEETLCAIYDLGIPTIWFWPNIDAGTDEISKGMRAFRENYNPHHIRFIKSLPPEEFTGLLKKAACLVGNSSAGIKECSYLGVPVVNIGTRQNHRLQAENVKNVGHDRQEIIKAVKAQVEHRKYPASNLYYKEGTSKKIAETLASIDLYTQKIFID